MTAALTVITSEQPRHLGKCFALDGQGQVVKTTAAQMTSGTFEVQHFETPGQLVALLQSFTTAQALCSSLPANGATAGLIVTRKALAANPGTIARTKDAFAFPSGQGGLLVLDYDPPKGGPALTRDELWAAVVGVAPALAGGLVLWWTSGSSCVFHDVTGEEFAGIKGQRLYIGIQDLSDSKRCLETLQARLDLAGHLRIDVSEAGSLLVRGLLDLAMAQPARLDFAPAGSVCSAPLAQRRSPPVVLADGGFIDTRTAIPDLTPDEANRREALIAEARDAKRSEASTTREAWSAARVAEGLPALMKQGLSAADAEERLRRTVDSAHAGVLLGDHVLKVVHHDGKVESVSVANVLANREAYDQADCLVPMNEEHRDGSPDAKLYLMSASPIVYSLDDGGQVWRLRRQADRIEVARGQRGDLVSRLVEWASRQDDLYMTDAGPVQLLGAKALPLTDTRLQLLISQRCAVFAASKGGPTPTDIQRDVAQLVLCALA